MRSAGARLGKRTLLRARRERPCRRRTLKGDRMTLPHVDQRESKVPPGPRLIAWSIQIIANGSSRRAFFNGPASTGSKPSSPTSSITAGFLPASSHHTWGIGHQAAVLNEYLQGVDCSQLVSCNQPKQKVTMGFSQ